MTVQFRTIRRVQKSERGSFSITLPNAWAKALGLVNGSIVVVLYGGRRAVIVPWIEGGDARHER